MNEHLTVLPDGGWERVLCIVAHPDDMEYGASAAVSAWTARGIEVIYVLLTAGEAGMAEPPEIVAPLRRAEQEAACAAVDVSELHILGHPDGMLVADLELRRDIAKLVRELRPDAVLTANFDFEAYGGLNQADHRAAGIAVIDGVRDASNPWVFRELGRDGLRAWKTKAILVAGHPEPNYAVPVSQVDVDRAVQSLECHKAYLEHIGDHPEPSVFISEILAEGGRTSGTDHAVVFKVYDLGGLGD
ncbi:PIG-L deacetylase family protein [Flaviflexus huanghaiensis]|uniref:PIG-L deacetylase family protein n=1 Tax=Flaviflexus huanghaiensis TaxID=1111473 RepID=UPI0015F79229|nr:PIG-L deacetylase family protein [Flaviflexus huanghaiensis]